MELKTRVCQEDHVLYSSNKLTVGQSDGPRPARSVAIGPYSSGNPTTSTVNMNLTRVMQNRAGRLNDIELQFSIPVTGCTPPRQPWLFLITNSSLLGYHPCVLLMTA